MRVLLAVLSLDGGGDGKCACGVCVIASISRSFLSSSTRFACSCSPAVMAWMRRADNAVPSLLPVRLLDLRCVLPSALLRQLEIGDERLLSGGKKAPVGVVDMIAEAISGVCVDRAQ